MKINSLLFRASMIVMLMLVSLGMSAQLNSPRRAPGVIEEPIGNQNQAKKLVVTTTDGTRSEFELNTKPVITMVKPYLVVEANGTQVSFELENLQSIKYEQMPDPSAINGLRMDKENGNICFNNLPSNADVSIYTLDGKLLMAQKPSESQSLSLPLSSLKQGVYLVKVNGITYKISKP